MTGANKKIKETKEEIREEEERLEGANGGNNAQLLEDQRNAENEVLRVKGEMSAHDQKNRDDQVAHQIAMQELDRTSRSVEAKNTEIRNKQNSLREIRAAEGDFLNVFGAKMPALLRAIDNERGFRVKPVGPIGNYITLRNPKWLSILERFFGSTLTAFVVTNYEDSEILKRLMRACNWYVLLPAIILLYNITNASKRIPVAYYSYENHKPH